MSRFLHRSAVAVAAASVLVLAACSGAGGDAGESDSVTFLTPQTSPERLAAQQAIAAAFEQESGIKVDVVPMAAADQDQALVTGAASGDVPDVILASATQTSAWNAQGLLDTDAAAATVEALGPGTFNERALQALTPESQAAAVPSDGWTHVIAYRKDLLEKAGVEPPTSLAELAAAATTIKEKLGITGLAFGTQAGTASATEGIQSLFQTAGCELVTDGMVTIDSPECTAAAEQFMTLRNSSTSGDFDVSSARAAYLNGDAGMLLFSTHLLDELAGLDDANPPTCEQCADDPAFLAKQSEFLTVLNPDNPRQYGTVLGYNIPQGANAEAAQRYVEYVMSTGYVDTLAVATEGRIPLRNGTQENPTEYLDAWGRLGIGAGAKASAGDLYGEEFVDSMSTGINSVYQWGMGTPDAELAGVVFNQGVLAAEIEQLYSGRPAAEVTAAMKSAVEGVQAGL
ncbi:ABC transporter substrate-binding protein [Naumannella huperziae]